MDKDIRRLKILVILFVFGLTGFLIARVIGLGLLLGWW